jgi:hypothetical protein
MSQMATLFRHRGDTHSDARTDTPTDTPTDSRTHAGAAPATGHPDVHDLGVRDRLHMPRSRGATTGLLLVLLGLWGGLVPFVGPALGYAFTPDNAWDFTWGRFWLEVLPAAATVLGGLWLMGTSNRISGWFGGWLAVAGGAWFVVGQEVSRLWNDGSFAAGVPAATSDVGQVAEWIGFFLGLGTVIVFLAAFALGRMSVFGVRDARVARERRYGTAAPVAAAEPAAHRRPVTPEERTD